MKAFKRFIAIFSLVTFLYPVLFQSLHYFNSHQEIETSNHNCCSVNDIQELDGSIVFQQHDLEDDCLLCEYEFSTKNFDNIPSLVFSVDVHKTEYFISYKESLIYFSNNTQTLRGPPALC